MFTWLGSWLAPMTWYQQAACAFFLGLLPLVVIGLWLFEPVADIWCDILDWWDYEVRGRKTYVTSVGGGGASNNGGRMHVTCAQCRQDLTGLGSCPVCGPQAAVSFSYVVGGAGGSGGSGGSTTFHSGGMVSVGAGGGGGVSYTPVCAGCGLAIPSGIVCSYKCLANYNGMKPSVAPGKGCEDCGSISPTYHAGCRQAGRVTKFLPSPGPYGSWGTPVPQPTYTQAPAPRATPSAPIPFSGMAGYSEKGTPQDWDMAVGAIRGYRWFKIDIPVSWAGYRTREIRSGYYDAIGKPQIKDPGMRELDDSELPSLIGAYGGCWKDGVNEATCSARANGWGSRPGRFVHQPPETREACGCGYWAYFDANLPVTSVLTSWGSPHQMGGAWTSIAVLGCVEGTGRVIVGEKGFRSQYAKIVALSIGQVSVPELMWWKHNARPNPNIGQSAYTAMGGGSAMQCSDEEIYARLAKIEDMLGRIYPSARIVSSESVLRNLFPPDKNYGGS